MFQMFHGFLKISSNFKKVLIKRLTRIIELYIMISFFVEKGSILSEKQIQKEEKK